MTDRLCRAGPGRILVAEDQPEIGEIIGAYLGRAGFDVDRVRDGEHARLALMRQNYDLVFLDLRLPRLDGAELLSHLPDGTRPKLALMSAQMDECLQFLNAGQIEAVLHKPFDPNLAVALALRLLGPPSPVNAG